MSISIHEGLTDTKCDICTKPTKWMVFWDGKPCLSRLVGLSCQKHVGYIVRRERIKEQLRMSINKPFLEDKEILL